MFNIYYDAPLRLLLIGIWQRHGWRCMGSLLCVIVLGFSTPSDDEVAEMRGL